MVPYILRFCFTVQLFQGFVKSQDRFSQCTEADASRYLEDQGREGLGVKLSNLLDAHFCARQEPPVDYNTMVQMCERFCAPGMPIVVGSETVGFNINEINTVCAADFTAVTESSANVLIHNPVLVDDCEQWSKSIDRMATRAANVVAAARELEFKQILFRARMQAQSELLKDEMLSENFTDVMTGQRRNSDRVDRIREKITLFMSRLMSGGEDQQALNQAVTRLEEVARALNRSVTQEVANVQLYVGQCGQLLTGQGSLDEYLLDICGISGQDCIEGNNPEDGDTTEFAKHAACCCGVIPASGIWAISANDSPLPEGRLLDEAKTMKASRHLQSEEEEEEEVDQNIDVCGLAYQLSQEAVSATIFDIVAVQGGADQIAQHEAGQATAYPDFYGGACRSVQSRRLSQQSNLTSFIDSKQDSFDYSSGTTTGRRLMTTERASPALQNCFHPSTTSNLSAFPGRPSDGPVTLPLKVGKWQGSEYQCQHSEDLENEDLAAQCQIYCGQAVPLVLGTSRSWGLSQALMDQVCLQPDPQGNFYNGSKVDICHRRASSFQRVKDRTSNFVSKLEILQATQVLFKGRTQTMFATLSRRLAGESQQVLDDAGTLEGAKIGAFKDLINRILAEQSESGGATIEIGDLQEALNNLVGAANSLQSALGEALPEMRAFLNECNMLTTGVGPHNEYLLDMCTTTGLECIDEHANVQHAGCCCAYNPVVTLGMSELPVHTIPGVDVMRNGETSVAPAARRVQSQVASQYLDICADASRNSATPIAEVRQDLALLGREDLMDELERERREKYPEYDQRCASDVIAEPSSSSSQGVSENTSVSENTGVSENAGVSESTGENTNSGLEVTSSGGEGLPCHLHSLLEVFVITSALLAA